MWSGGGGGRGGCGGERGGEEGAVLKEEGMERAKRCIEGVRHMCRILERGGGGGGFN